MASRNLTEHVKIGLAAGAMFAAWAGYLLARLKTRARDNEDARKFLADTPIVKLGKFKFNLTQTFVAALMIFAIFGTLNYNRYSTKLMTEGYDEYDLLHYYVTPKYFDELGYFRLLPALIIADHEQGQMCPGKAPIYLAQDEDDYARRPIRHALAKKKEIKSHFTEARWKEFTHDTIYIQRKSKRLKCHLWRQLLQDHGFNGTPTWVLMARPIVNMVPVEYIKIATFIDLAWLIVALLAIAWAFGLEAAAFAWIFITIGYSFRWPTITWALLRYDWLASMVIGICMIKKEKHVAGGAFFAYAALMRYFPALWLFGIFAKGLHAVIVAIIEFIKIKRGKAKPRKVFFPKGVAFGVPNKYWKMFGGFIAAIALLVSISVAVDGVQAHKTSFQNMTAHVEAHNLSSMRQGLQIALTYRGETDLKLISNEKKEMVAQNEDAVRIGALLMMIVLGLFMTRARDWEVVGLGLIPYFWLTTSSYYYYSMRITAVLIHAADLKKTRNVVGLLMLFGIELFSHASQYVNKDNRYMLISIMGLMLAAYSVVMMVFLGKEWWRARRLDREPEKENS